MDIMMPEMDGYETMQVIRRIFTAEASDRRLDRQGDEGDREKCLGGGRVGIFGEAR